MRKGLTPVDCVAMTPASVAACVLAGGLTLASGLAWGQAAGRGGLTIEPSIGAGVKTSYRDGDSGSSSKLVGTVSPSIRLLSRSGRVQGEVDYGLTAALRSGSTDRTSLQQRLAATVRAEAVPNHLDVTARGSIYRQAASAFGTQVADPTLTDENQSEVRTLSVQPALRGVLGGVVRVRASATAERSSSSRGDFTSSGQGAALNLSSVASGTIFGWALDARRDISNYDGGRETTTDRVIATVTARPDADWLFSVRGGKERTDVASIQSRVYDNWGAGARWTPSPRTTAAVDVDRRYYGDGFGVSLQHRMRRTVLSYNGSRSAADSISQGVAPIRAYELFFELFASQEPDPVLRDLLVRGFLDRNGIPADAVIGGIGFLTRATALQTRHQFSVAVSGVRDSIVATVYTSRSERVDTVSGVVDDLAIGPIEQRGLSVSVSHRLTPRDSITANLSASHTLASDARPDSRLYSLALAWSSRLSERAAFALTLRHSDYASDASGRDYSEIAAGAAFNTRF